MARTVFISGASRGIGRSAALLFAKGGWQVAVGCLTHEREAEALAGAIRAGGGRAFAVRGDVSDPAQAQDMARRCREELGDPEVLVNNAGVDLFGLITDFSYEQWRRILAVDLDGAFLMTKAFLPAMIEAKKGCILNVSSVWGVRGAACEVPYCAAKAGLIGFTRALAKEVGPSGVRVNAVAPGVIDTDMNACLKPEEMEALRLDTPLERIGTPEEVARALYFLADGDAAFITGQVLGVDGGFAL